MSIGDYMVAAGLECTSQDGYEVIGRYQHQWSVPPPNQTQMRMRNGSINLHLACHYNLQGAHRQAQVLDYFALFNVSTQIPVEVPQDLNHLPHSVSTRKKIHIHLRNTSRNSMRNMPPSRSLKWSK